MKLHMRNKFVVLLLLYFTIETKQEIIKILKFYSMEQEITHYSRGKLHVAQNNGLKLARICTSNQ